MARRNRRQRANERRRKMKTYESEPELGSDEQSELSGKDSYHPHSDTDIHEAQVLQQQNMHKQIEIKVESPISNPISNANAKHVIDHRRNVKSLHRAVLRGDWKAAKTALSVDQNIGCIQLTKIGDFALHIAVTAKQTAFVHNLVKHMNTIDLELQNRHGNTAFCIAAVSGVVEIAKVMYEKNNNLPLIRSSIGKTPLEMAILFGNRQMVEYLYQITPLEELNAEEHMEILVPLIHIDMYDMALKILNSSRIVISTTNVERALRALARKPLRHHGFRGHWMWERLVRTIAYISHFGRIYSTQQMMPQAHQLVKRLWEKIIILPDSNVTSQILHDAAKGGNVELLTLLTDSYPDIIWKVDSNKYSIFHVAVINRQERVFSLINHIGAVKNFITLSIDKKRNNILHLAGKLAPPSRLKIVSGAALQMQRELQWFKEVEKIVPSSFLHMRNKAGLTPKELFSAQHEALRQDGEKWMKNTVSFCLVVATLIATIAFAAAITMPGGSNQESGTPILLKDRCFKVFVISNALAMLSSITSILIYLSVLISSYVEDDFLISLPRKLMLGLYSILVSIICMVSAFYATFCSIYNEENQGPLRGLVAGLTFLPVILCEVLNLKFRFKFWKIIDFSNGWPAGYVSV